MDYFEKVEWVRNNIHEWQNSKGNEFCYVMVGLSNEIKSEDRNKDPNNLGDKKGVIDPREQEEIIEYLARTKFLEIIDQTSWRIKILPWQEPAIKNKALEQIAKELQNHYSKSNTASLLKECGVLEKFIVYADTEWIVFYRVFRELSISRDMTDNDLLFRILCESIHPLYLNGDTKESEILAERFNNYLEYNRLILRYSRTEKKYDLCKEENSEPEKLKKTSKQTATDGMDEIYYNNKTGIGEINGRAFKIKPSNNAFEVFASLYGTINNPVGRQDVLISSSFYQEGESPDSARRVNETYHVNKIAKTIRRVLKIDTTKLINNDGNLTLVGIKLKFPKVDQT